ncbi:hypothetical protein VNO77_26730 [Canavalia gladiata]|uniref:Uncharacterized protein n=1 Tax=Canavalia gladiata TaxID=3824 RepID=A0AAN9KST5_CANGL
MSDPSQPRCIKCTSTKAQVAHWEFFNDHSSSIIVLQILLITFFDPTTLELPKGSCLPHLEDDDHKTLTPLWNIANFTIRSL